ncbi:hypothetical protein PR048_032535 [Dryococelus australis]|uniref:Uncharacterized protein n=1 Tax=Dryococelus australis TaxID=614101 RepID=A0ABQ9G2H2_9NEOP|nr:hypothetical protein PR048_032535 [Dryococelus australis]
MLNTSRTKTAHLCVSIQLSSNHNSRRKEQLFGVYLVFELIREILVALKARTDIARRRCITKRRIDISTFPNNKRLSRRLQLLPGGDWRTTFLVCWRGVSGRFASVVSRALCVRCESATRLVFGGFQCYAAGTRLAPAASWQKSRNVACSRAVNLPRQRMAGQTAPTPTPPISEPRRRSTSAHEPAMNNAYSARTRQQNGAAVHQRVGTTFANHRLVTYVADAFNIDSPLEGGRDGRAVRSLASHQGEPCSIPGRVHRILAWGNRARTMPLVDGFSQGSPVSPALSFQRCSTPQPPLSALKTSLLRAASISLLTYSSFEVGGCQFGRQGRYRLFTSPLLLCQEFFMHALDNSEPIADLQGNKKRIPYCQV